jgi:hypothetical protein
VNVTGYNPRSWHKTAQIKTIELFMSESAGTEKIFLNIPANQIWTLLRPPFERLSHNKCWFSEAYTSVSDFQVEHFRPKKAVHLIKNKDAYPEKRTVRKRAITFHLKQQVLLLTQKRFHGEEKKAFCWTLVLKRTQN